MSAIELEEQLQFTLDNRKFVLRSSSSDGRAIVELETPHGALELSRAEWLAVHQVLGRLLAPLDVPPQRPSSPAKRTNAPPRQGQTWAAEEDVGLLDAWNAGALLSDLADRHGRSPGALTSRLVSLGVAKDRDDLQEQARDRARGAARAGVPS